MDDGGPGKKRGPPRPAVKEAEPAVKKSNLFAPAVKKSVKKLDSFTAAVKCTE